MKVSVPAGRFVLEGSTNAVRRRTREKKEELSDWSLASRMPQTLLPAPPERERRGSKVGDPGGAVERWATASGPVENQQGGAEQG